jgi:hypothetical protein|tara:strand:- start:120 stop:494 length:375 start_codon:yes stop_codon:yes gene_type:complete
MTKQVKTLEKQIEDLTKAVSLLTELALKKEQPEALPLVSEQPEVAFSEDFQGKFRTQLPRATALAKKKGHPVELAAVPKGTGFSCWYYQQGLKRLSKDSQKLAVVYSDGRIEPMVQLGNLIESV